MPQFSFAVFAEMKNNRKKFKKSIDKLTFREYNGCIVKAKNTTACLSDESFGKCVFFISFALKNKIFKI